MIYEFQKIEEQARDKWSKNDVYKVNNTSDKPKYYVLDMFPYPSGAGLHVGHPLGYIFSDIYARYKRMKGFNVLHPMGFDAFGLPAEQYAIQTGQHPEITTKKNIETYINQLKKIGFSYDWNRQVTTCEPAYYKHTQWIFLQLFNTWYNKGIDKADSILNLISAFEKNGNASINAACFDDVQQFSAQQWNAFSALEKQTILMEYRLAFQKESFVNWCPALGTVLANDEIVNGVSERGGHPVEKKKMSQWFLRITAYADRLLQGLDTLDWSDSMKEMQRNWIGKSIGAMVSFKLENNSETSEKKIDVFTTRVDTLFGVSFVVIAPEHELVKQITTPEFAGAVEDYIKICASKSDIERQAEKQVSGQFTGAYVLHPFSNEKIPVYIADYVLAGYGTGAVMAVPSGDQRDYLFAKKFDLPIISILDAQKIESEADSTKEGKYINSDFINGLNYKEATALIIQKLEAIKMGFGKVNFRMRDAGYSRQRYWGEPFPIYYDKDGLIQTIAENKLPIILPKVESYKPTGTGESPLATATEWVTQNGEGTRMETDTMPGYAGSSWYFLRYMNPNNTEELVSKEAQEYWQNVDFYVGGNEHAVGHLLYSRFWHKFLKDIGKVSTEEPFKKMVNQGMIQGVSKYLRVRFGTYDPDVERIGVDMDSKSSFSNWVILSTKIVRIILPHNFIKLEYPNRILNDKDEFAGEIYILFPTEFTEYKAGKYYVNQKLLDDAKLIYPHLEDLFLHKLEDLKHHFREDKEGLDDEILNGNYEVKCEVEKMSKSKFNVVNPDQIIEQYGADTFRMYEMFLGPIDTAKPWDTNGISGVSNFLRKFWRLFYDDLGNRRDALNASNNIEPTQDELKILHKTIKKVNQDIENLSFNTCISTFMICVNELAKLKTVSTSTLSELIKLIAPFAPHTAETLWSNLGNQTSVFEASFPKHDEQYLVESAFSYPIQINGKHRANIELALDIKHEDIQKIVLADEKVLKFTEGKEPKKFIVVQGRIINVVV